jgi:hypothetical protein
VVWNVDDGRVTARAPAQRGARALTVLGANLVIAVTGNEATWIALPDASDAALAASRADGGAALAAGTQIHVRLFAPVSPGGSPRLLVDASDGRLDGDPALVTAARYRIDDKALTVDEVVAHYGADPRTPHLLRAWLAEHHAGT